MLLENAADTQNPAASPPELLAGLALDFRHHGPVTGPPLSLAQTLEARQRTQPHLDLLRELTRPDLERDVAQDRCVAYGDSTSDAALFAALPCTVAVNATPALQNMARAAWTGIDLRGAYAVARRMLDEELDEAAG